MVFNLTWSERERLRTARFLQKREILEGIEKLSLDQGGALIRLKNMVHVDGSFRKHELDYILPVDKDKFASDMMDISMSYAILWLGCDALNFNEVVVARTAHNTTNIDADVIGAFLAKMGDNHD